MTDTAALSVEAPPQTDWDISSAEDLKSIKYNAGRDHRFHLMNDIEITDEYWNPIGSSKQPFSGAFYGNNHTITFTKDTELIQSYGAENSGCGLFGYIYAGQICDLNIVFQGNLTSAENNTGAVVGMLDGNYSYSASTPPLLHNCKVSAKRYSITGLENTGGLVGCVVNGSIENCSSDASVISQKKNAGGSAGYVFNGTFINSS
ncbi:MAG: hypothetical protein LBU81_03610, partial [Methanosarcinales archaeon]|nr:hypothetical protein [Methanosarcinales archaeon]